MTSLPNQIIETFNTIEYNLNENINKFSKLEEHKIKENKVPSGQALPEISSSINVIKLININIRDNISHLKVQFEEHNTHLNNRIEKLETNNTKLEIKNTSLTDRLNKLELNELKKHLKISVNDLNEIYSLEQTEDKKFNQNMFNLRCSRDGDSHYIRTKNKIDTEDMKKYKMKLIKDKLVKYKELNLRDIFPDKLIDILSDKIKDLDESKLDDDEKQDAEDWWDE